MDLRMLWIFLSHTASFGAAGGSLLLYMLGVIYCDDCEETPKIKRTKAKYVTISVVLLTVCLALYALAAWLSFRLRRGPMPWGFMTTRWILLAATVSFAALRLAPNGVIGTVTDVGLPYTVSLLILWMIPYPCTYRRPRDERDSTGLYEAL